MCAYTTTLKTYLFSFYMHTDVMTREGFKIANVALMLTYFSGSDLTHFYILGL